MLTDKDKEVLIAAAMIIKIESRWHYDMYKRESDGGDHDKLFRAYERYRELDRLANELDIIAFGNL